jgi:hypothetical protein
MGGFEEVASGEKERESVGMRVARSAARAGGHTGLVGGY